MQIDKYFSTPYEGYFVSKDGEVASFRKPGVAKKCMYQGITYGSIKDACKAAGITVNYYYSHPEIIAKTLAEGVETIEIRKVSRVGRKWLPVEAHTSSNA